MKITQQYLEGRLAELNELKLQTQQRFVQAQQQIDRLDGAINAVQHLLAKLSRPEEGEDGGSEAEG